MAISGVSTSPIATLELQYGYGNEILFTQKINLDYSQQETNTIALDKIWAQQKINQLEEQYDIFKNEIEALGKKYTIATRNTSLIVLDAVADYVRYKIEPPVELKAEYEKLLQQEAKVANENFTSIMDDTKYMMQDLLAWYKKDFSPYIQCKVIDKDDYSPLKNVSIKLNGINYLTNDNGELLVKNIENATAIITHKGYLSQTINMDGYNKNGYNIALEPVVPKEKAISKNGFVKKLKSIENNSIQGIVIDTKGNPLSGASITYNKNRGVATDANGYFKITTTEPISIKTSYVGFETMGAKLQNGSYYEIELKEREKNYEENVIVTGYSAVKRNQMEAGEATAVADTARYYGSDADREDVVVKRSVTASVQTISAKQINSVPAASFDQKLEGRAAGMYIQTTPVTFGATSNANAIYDPYNKDIQLNDKVDKKVNSIEIKEITSKKEFIITLKETTATTRYEKYLQLRENYLYTPSFYFEVATFFFQEKDTATGLVILSTVADLNLQDHELYKMLGYQLKKLGQYNEATNVFRKVLQWRPQEPQSYRDYALALQDEGLYQNAIDSLYTCLTKNFDTEISNAYDGIEETILMDINNIMTLQKNVLPKAIPKELIANLPVDVRVVLNWNMNDTDMDLWIIDPLGEKCYYSNKQSKLGGKLSDDFTNGYGPEQFILKNAKKGKYKVMLHYYGDEVQKIAGGSTILAEIYTNFSRINQQRKLITLQMEKGEEKEGILVGEFSFK